MLLGCIPVPKCKNKNNVVGRPEKQLKLRVVDGETDTVGIKLLWGPGMCVLIVATNRRVFYWQIHTRPGTQGMYMVPRFFPEWSHPVINSDPSPSLPTR